jgi:hypothetical protein
MEGEVIQGAGGASGDEIGGRGTQVQRARRSWQEAEPMPICGSAVVWLWLGCGCDGLWLWLGCGCTADKQWGAGAQGSDDSVREWQGRGGLH